MVDFRVLMAAWEVLKRILSGLVALVIFLLFLLMVILPLGWFFGYVQFGPCDCDCPEIQERGSPLGPLGV